MALTLSRRCAIEEKSTMDMERENRNKKVDPFVNSCDYDIKEGNLDVLMYRVNQFKHKYKNLDQDVMLGLFKKIWVENNPILKWILENMDEKTMRSAFGDCILEGDEKNDDENDEDEFEEDDEFWKEEQ